MTASAGGPRTTMARLDLDPLVRLGDLAARWRDAHREGGRHLETVAALFTAATEEPDETEARGWRTKDGVAARVARAAPSPRLEAFLDAGRWHPSVAAAAPQKLTDAIDAVVAAARTCEGVAVEAESALDAFIAACSLGGIPPPPSPAPPPTGEVGASLNPSPPAATGGHWMDAVPTAVLFTRVPWGDPPHRTIEEWLWLCTAVVESLGEEAAVKRGTADYLSQLPGSGEDGEETEAEPLTREKLQGCAEVWGMEPFLDRDLFNTLANAGK